MLIFLLERKYEWKREREKEKIYWIGLFNSKGCLIGYKQKLLPNNLIQEINKSSKTVLCFHTNRKYQGFAWTFGKIRYLLVFGVTFDQLWSAQHYFERNISFANIYLKPKTDMTWKSTLVKYIFVLSTKLSYNLVLIHGIN